MSDLIVNAVEPRVQYLADGAQTVFPFPFPVLEAGDLVARVDGAEPPVAPTLAGLGESAGGTATFATPPADGAVVTLWRAMPVRRLTDFQEAGEFRARAINAELDRLTLMVQEAAHRAGRALAPSLSASVGPQELPPAAPNGYIKWDDAGETLIADDTVPEAVTTSAANAAAAASSASAAAISATSAAASASDAAVSAADAAASATAAAQARSDFGVVAVPGKGSVGADQAGDTLTLVEGAGLALTPDSGNDSIAFALADGGVATAKLADSAVTTAKLNDGAVTAAKLDSGLSLGAPAGSVLAFAGASAPSGWLLCHGQAISRATYAALFSAIGTSHGTGDGSTTFNLPDLRGRVIAGKDDMGGSAASRLTSGGSGITGSTLGATGGAETHTLTTGQMPSHAHDLRTKDGNGNMAAATTNLISSSYTIGAQIWNAATSADRLMTNSIEGAGGGGAHNNAQPTLVLNWIIKT